MKPTDSFQTALLFLRKPFLAAVLLLHALPLVHAQLFTVQQMRPDVVVQLRAETTGEISISAWSSNRETELAPDLAGVLHCQKGVKPDPYGTIALRCLNALHRDGLALEGVIDLAPIARTHDPSNSMQLYLNTPRLGFFSTSIPMEEEEMGMRTNQSIRFEAGAIPSPIKIRFGYRPDQLPAIYLPLVVIALALTLIAWVLGRAGLAALSRSLVLLGTIVWMGAASELQSEALIRILLYSNPMATPAALFIAFWPPLLCIAAGAALGSAVQPKRKSSGVFSRVFWGLYAIPLILTCVVGALPVIMTQDWPQAVAWLAVAPIVIFLRRSWVRKSTGARTQQLSSGELKDRIAQLASRVGRPQVKVIISFSERTNIAAAFALPRKIIYLTAHLVRSLSKREVDAVAAHELSHFTHSQRGQYMSLAMAMVLFDTPVNEVFLSTTTALLLALLVPVAVLLGALALSRRRELAADANAAALTADPQAMISSLARVARINNSPLDMSPVAEWMSSHPSTRKRIRSLAAAARLSTAEVESLCAAGEPTDFYEIPQEQKNGNIFTHAWQITNAGIYGWIALLTTPASGLLIACLLQFFHGAGALAFIFGIVLGCLLTKAFSSAVMATNYARLGRKLDAKLGCGGKVMGLAIGSEPRLYNGFRFADVGLLRFENGRLIYTSERTTIALNPGDIAEVAMIDASPALWFRQQPMVRFRSPGSGEVKAIVLHPVSWFITQPSLLRSIQRWRTATLSADATLIEGFNPIPSQPVRNLATVAGTARAFFVSGGVAFTMGVLFFNADWGYIAYAIVVTAAAHTFMFLPALLYRPPAPAPDHAPAAAAN